MAADVPVKQPPVNPCCAEWKEKYLKAQVSRKNLRQALNLLNQEADKIQADNASLKKALEEERALVVTEKEEKERESALRFSLENEISALKSEIYALQQKATTDAKDKIGVVKLFQDHGSEGEGEINHLKEMLEKERIRADSEKKNAEAQKKSAAETLKQVKAEKSKADKERKNANIELMKAEQYRLQLEALQKEASEAKSKLVSMTLKLEEANRKLEAEKHESTKERERADSEMANVEEQRKLAEANGKKALEEKSHAQNLSGQLVEARQKIKELQQEINQFTLTRNSPEAPDDQCNENSNAETTKKECRLWLDNLKNDAHQLNLVLKFLKSEEATQMFEVEKHKVVVQKECEDSGIITAEERRNLSRQFDDGRHKIEELQKQIQQLLSSREEVEEATKRFEVEKQRIMDEKKCAEWEMMNAEELRKLAQDNRRMAIEEKSRTDQMSCQLEEDRHKIEDLQKQMQELLSSRKAVDEFPMLTGKDITAEMTKLKLVKKKLKLEKMRSKHAKQVATIEKKCNSILWQELGQLKLDFTQILCRLDVLDKCNLPNAEGTRDMDKAADSANIQRSKLKRKYHGLEPLQINPQNESELLKPTCTTLAASDHLRQTVCCTTSLHPICGGNCTESISGIDFKLEPPRGGSKQKLLHSSAINSSSASFSDSQLIRSQERGAFITTSEKLVEKTFNMQPAVSGISAEISKIQHNENLAVVAENSIRSPHRSGIKGRVNGHSRKRKKMLDAIESVEFLHSEGKKLHMKMEERISFLHHMMNRKPLEQPKCVEPSLQGAPYPKNERYPKKRKVSQEETVNMQYLSDTDELEKTKNTGKKVIDQENTCRHASPHANYLMGIPQAYMDTLNVSFGADLETMATFEGLVNGDCMKLLDLDNIADEECYRRAMERPMSPTLPEIGFSSPDIADKFKVPVGETFSIGFSNDMEIPVPSSSFDVIGVEISSNIMRHNASVTSCDKLPQKKEGTVDSFGILGGRDDFCITLEAGRVSGSQTVDSRVEVEMLTVPNSRDESRKFPCETELGFAHENIPNYVVIFSDVNDSMIISRIFLATRICMAYCSLDTRTGCMVKKVLHTLKMEEKFSSKEKACAFFTMLLLNYCACTSGISGSFVDRGFVSCLDACAGHINAVVSDVEARSLLAEVCCLDYLLGLIEDFLIYGRVMVYTDVSSETLIDCGSRMNILLDGANINLFSKLASADQLVTGSIILASICAAIDHIGFICEASYNLLRMHMCETAIVLTILHVFAYLVGEKFFSLNTHSFAMTVLKSVVMFLERGNSSVASASSSLSSTNRARVDIHPSVKCAFSVDAVSVDTITSVLLEKLRNCAIFGTMHKHLTESTNLSVSGVLCHKDKAEQNLNPEDYSVLDVNYGASCGLKKSVMPATRSKCVLDGTICDLGDALSLVELIACTMSWEWTCIKIIPMLLDVLQRPKLDNFAIAVVVLIGQLGRLGVSACGYEDKGVENLRCRLSGFLWRDSTIRAPLPVQIATVTALLGLVTPDFEEIVRSNSEFPATASQSGSSNLIRKWFSLLSKEQQELSFGLLRSAATVELR